MMQLCYDPIAIEVGESHRTTATKAVTTIKIRTKRNAEGVKWGNMVMSVVCS